MWRRDAPSVTARARRLHRFAGRSGLDGGYITESDINWSRLMGGRLFDIVDAIMVAAAAYFAAPRFVGATIWAPIFSVI